MDTPILLQIVEIALAAFGIAFGVIEYNKRQKLEEAFKAFTQSYPGDVAKIHESCHWAWTNVRDALKEVAKMPNSDEKEKSLTFISNAIGDTAASARMAINLFNQLLTLQKAQFGTRELVHPQKKTLALCMAEAQSQEVAVTVPE